MANVPSTVFVSLISAFWLRPFFYRNETRIPLWAKRRPEVGIGYIRETTVGDRWDLGQLVDGLLTIVLAIEILSGRVERCVFLQVVRPVGHGYGITARPACFERILIDRGVDVAKIVQDFCCLGSLSRPQKSGDSDC